MLQGMAPEFDEFRAIRLDLWKDVLLVEVRNGLTGLAIRVNAFGERSVIELAVQPHPTGKPIRLTRVRIELEGHFPAFHAGILPESISSDKGEQTKKVTLLEVAKSNRPLDPLLSDRPRLKVRAANQAD